MKLIDETKLRMIIAGCMLNQSINGERCDINGLSKEAYSLLPDINDEEMKDEK